MTNGATPMLWSRLRTSGAGAAARRAARRVIDGCTERYLNIATAGSSGMRGGGHHGDSNHYEPLDYPFLVQCLDALELKPDDVVFEIGCGMGRALCLLARRPIDRCVGVELCEDLADTARVNVGRLRGRRAPTEVITGDATFVDYSQGTAFYIFNSFGPVTLAAVLRQIRDGAERNPRPLRIIYVNPLHQDVFEAAGWLRLTRHVRSPWFRMEATCWAYEPAPAEATDRHVSAGPAATVAAAAADGGRGR